MPRRHRSSSPLSPPVVIILLPTIVLLFLIYAIPPILSVTSQLLQPTISVKKSWDSLNVFLVLFAILCGVFAIRNEEALPDLDDDVHIHVHHHHSHADPLAINNAINTSSHEETESSSSSSEAALQLPQQQWFCYSERTSFKIYDAPKKFGGGGLRRSSSLYPDLRQAETLWQTRDDDDDQSKFRFFDDFEISNYKTHRHYRESEIVKEIPVDTSVAVQSSKSKSPPPPPPPPPRRHQQKSRTYETVARPKIVEKVRSTPPTPPPPPPPRTVTPPLPIMVRSDKIHKKKLERRKSNVKKEIAMVWASVVVSTQRERERKQKATRNVYGNATSDPSAEEHQSQLPPPPPPSSVFHNLFKKGSKTKKIHSVATAPPPAPPPPPPPVPQTPPRQPPSSHSRRRPLRQKKSPTTSNTTHEDIVVINSGCQSPLIPIPPPPPPFKMPELKFFVRGDFVKIRSAQSSRCGSPKPGGDDVVDELDSTGPAGGNYNNNTTEELTSSATTTVNAMDGGDDAVVRGSGSASVFCPSPDVNTKADNFIARLRDEWKLEKMNSLREKKMN